MPTLKRFLARFLVRTAAAIVPASYRDRFREEWLAEIWHAETSPLEKTTGVFVDAFRARQLHREREDPVRGGREGLVPAFWEDIRYAIRSFVKRPGWTLVVVFTLAIGIGANTAIFGLVHAVLLKPLSYPDSERLVKIVGRDLETGERRNISPADFQDLEAQSTTLESMGAHNWVGFYTLSTDGDAVRIPGSSVTAGFFETLGVSPILGRRFTREDDRPAAPPTVLLSHALWQSRFGGDGGVVGRSVTVNAVEHEILGVLPADYRHPEPNPEREPLLYRLFRFEPGANRSGRFIRGVGRLAPGRSIEEARSELITIARRLEEAYPETNAHRGVDLMRLKEAIVGRARNGLLVLLAAVFAVLLIACANVANLQLAHGSARQHELGIKAALGARRGRLVRQLVTESLVLAGLGGGIGLVLGYGMRSFLAVRTIPRAESVSFDWPVFAFALAVSSFAAVVFGLAPALSLSSSGIARSIVGGSSHRATRRSGTRSILVGLEVTVSLVLLVSAALLLKSLSALQSVEPGFSPERVATMQVSLPIARYPEGDQIPFYDDLLRRIRALPGVSHAGAINILPLSANYSSDGFQVEERPVPPGEKPSAEARSVDREYFEAMGIPLIRGRLFDERDRPGSPGVIVVSEQMASKFWPGEDPIGKRITYNRALPEDESKEVGGPGSREIVGVVGDVKHLGLDDADVAMFYTPRTHHPSFHTMTLVIRGEIDVDVVAAAVRDAVRAMDPEVPVYAVRSLNEVIESTVAGPRYRTILLGSFAAFALILALVGVYAVMGLLVSQRTREIGIRMALGARAGDVVRMLVSESMKPVLWGIAIGLSAALSLSRYLASLLFRVEPRDPAVYLTVTGLLAAAALASALLPSLRATRIDPTRSLQTEDGARLE